MMMMQAKMRRWLAVEEARARSGLLLLLAATPVQAFLPPSWCRGGSSSRMVVVQSSSVTQPGMPPARTKSLWDPVLYQGPVPEGGAVQGVEAAAVLEEYNLVLEVGQSVAVPGERGLFVRTTGKELVEEVTVPWGSLLCGYGEGEVRQAPGGGDKSVLFSMPSAEMAVFFNRELLPLYEVLAEACPEGTGLLGHDVTVGDKGELSVTPKQDGPKYYFVPREGLPNKAAFIGLFANDLAIDPQALPQSQEQYEEASRRANLGGLVWRVEYDPHRKMVVPSRPVVTFLRTFSFRNDEPMEVGLHYGFNTFWAKLQQQQQQP